MLCIAICDDERIHLRHTAELIDSALAARSADISCFDSSEALLQAVVSGYAPDIAVLDIQMGEMDGISLAKRLNALTPSCRIIFVTSYLAFATEVYSTELIPVKDVKYVERLGRKTHVVAAGSELWSAHAPAELLSGHEERFIRCHQSIWVNPQWVSAMKNDEFMLKDGASLPISRGYKQSARDAFFASLRRPEDAL